ncbi:hypothetical protein [Bradyrhizobium cosmicum]|uniref:hypothetical protein n=1 Tax=Bradyrhizobium cosmicum TaxID=1404864 RepID=UPI0028E3D9F3|nr:hypothetical protein [Bradyrhizobium cosmicum]
MFIAMDPPEHGPRRRTVSPVFAPGNLASMERLIRSRTIDVIESLPVGETFDWVDRVSTELTSQMLATLFDFPFEKRRRLTHWSEVATSSPATRETGTSENGSFRIASQALQNSGKNGSRFQDPI